MGWRGDGGRGRGYRGDGAIGEATGLRRGGRGGERRGGWRGGCRRGGEANYLRQITAQFLYCGRIAVVDAGATHSPYRSLATFLANYNRMLSDLKICVYDQSKHPPASPLELLFHTHLLRSPFLTPDPDLAHLFYLSFPGRASARSIAHSIRHLRHDLPYWNRSLGTDHFYLLCEGLGPHSDRNLVELRKNTVQVSYLPPATGKFIPYKDISLPRPLRPGLPPALSDAARRRRRYLGYYLGDATENATSFLDELRNDLSFLVESSTGFNIPHARAFEAKDRGLFLKKN